jgi:hypothetical protein
MNRHERRRAEAKARRAKQSARFWTDYVQHLPEVSFDTPMERGRVYHIGIHHDAGCQYFCTGQAADCNCGPVMTKHVEPIRS